MATCDIRKSFQKLFLSQWISLGLKPRVALLHHSRLSVTARLDQQMMPSLSFSHLWSLSLQHFTMRARKLDVSI